MRHDADDAARARDISPRCRVSATRFPVRSFGLRALVGVVVVVVVVVAVLPQRVSSRTPVCEGRRFKRKKKIWFCSTRKSRHLSFFFKAAAAVENNTHAPPEPSSSSSSSSSSSPPFGRRSLLVNTAKNNWLCKVL